MLVEIINRQMDFLEIFELALWHSWGLWEMEMNSYITVDLNRTYWMSLQFQASIFLALALFFGKLFIASGQLLTRENWVFDSFSLLSFVCMHVLLIFPWPLLLCFYINHPPVLLGSDPVSYPKSLFFFSPQSPMKPAQQNYNSYFPV